MTRTPCTQGSVKVLRSYCNAAGSTSCGNAHILVSAVAPGSGTGSVTASWSVRVIMDPLLGVLIVSTWCAGAAHKSYELVRGSTLTSKGRTCRNRACALRASTGCSSN